MTMAQQVLFLYQAVWCKGARGSGPGCWTVLLYPLGSGMNIRPPGGAIKTLPELVLE